MESVKIGIIGAGVMGQGIAHAIAQKGIKPVIVDTSEKQLEAAREAVYLNVRYYSMFHKNEHDLSADEIVNNLILTINYDEIKDADFIIENVPEQWEIKAEVYKKLDSICNRNTIFAVNTSAISITKVGAITKRPEKIIGMHFMNPVPLKKIVEVVKGFHTDLQTIEKSTDMLKIIGKKAVIVNDYPGFVSNRVSHLYMNEAAWLVQDNVATPENVDIIFKEGYGHAMGPLETADLIGLDTVVNTLDVLYGAYQDPKFRCCLLLRKMVEAGHYGKKSGKGFYEYNSFF